MGNMKAFLWFNAIGFQVVWWSCILFHARYFGLLAVGVAAAYVACHFYGLKEKKAEFKFVALVFAMALIGEALTQMLGIYRVDSFWPLPYLIPLWLMALWIAFACTLRHALKMILNRPKIAIFVTMIMGPFSYLSGHQFGVLEFSMSTGAFATFAMIWGTYMSLILILNKRV